MGKNIEFKGMQWISILPALLNNKIDLAGSVNITEERKKNFDFSNPYYFNSLVIVFNKKLPIKNKDELNDKKIGFLFGSAPQYDWLIKNVKNSKLISIDNDSLLIQSLQANHIDGFLSYKESAMIYCEKNTSIDYSELGISKNGLAFAMKKNSPLLLKINQALDNLKSRGEITRLEKKWFDSE